MRKLGLSGGFRRSLWFPPPVTTGQSRLSHIMGEKVVINEIPNLLGEKVTINEIPNPWEKGDDKRNSKSKLNT